MKRILFALVLAFGLLTMGVGCGGGTTSTGSPPKPVTKTT
jgi:hypothetical protein